MLSSILKCCLINILSAGNLHANNLRLVYFQFWKPLNNHLFYVKIMSKLVLMLTFIHYTI